MWLLVVGLAAIGGAIRVATAGHAMFADELSTYWIITARRAAAGTPALHGLGGVLSLVGHRYPGGDTAEISPPLYFALAWLTTQLGHAPLLVRAPSLIAGVAIVPLVYLVGQRTIGRAGALVATGLSAFCPFLIYYSGEARAYSVLMALLLISTLAMLQAITTGARRWWVLYALATTGAMLAHYTAAYLLAGQLLWLLIAHPHARRAALASNVAAALLFAPWLPAAIREYRSPTLKILSLLSPFDFTSARVSLEHWVIGFPYSNVSVQEIPGRPALVLLALAGLISVAALIRRRSADGAWPAPALDPRAWLVIVLAVSVPLLEALQSAVSTHVFGGRNLAAATTGVLLLVALLLTALPGRARLAVIALTSLAFVLGATQLLHARYQRPDVAAATHYVLRTIHPGDAVVDETVAFSPGPLSALDTTLPSGIPVFRAGNPAERDHPFTLFDPIVKLGTAIATAAEAHPDGRIYLVGEGFPDTGAKLGTIGKQRLSTGGAPAVTGADAQSPIAQSLAQSSVPIPPGYHEVDQRYYPGYPGVRVQVFAPATKG